MTHSHTPAPDEAMDDSGLPADPNTTGRLPGSSEPVVLPSATGETPSTPKPSAATPRPPYPKRSSKPKEPPSFLTGMMLGLLAGLLLSAIAAVVLFLEFREDVRTSQIRATEAEQRVTDLRDEVDTLRTDLSLLEARAEQVEALAPRLDALEQREAAMGTQVAAMGATVDSMGTEVQAMGETVGTMERSLGTLQARTQAFDAFLLGLRDLSLRANPLPESAVPADPTSPTLTIAPSSIRQGEAALITGAALDPSTRYDIALINELGEATLLGQVQSSSRGQLRFQLREQESTDITPALYTIALYPENDAEPVANGELRVTGR
ncbi:MAG: hypothetical protein H0T73_23940 [Ardenticatenales bacterium]|nr:hypothetical protein [Ardenticatenales bacterium]